MSSTSGGRNVKIGTFFESLVTLAIERVYCYPFYPRLYHGPTISDEQRPLAVYSFWDEERWSATAILQNLLN